MELGAEHRPELGLLGLPQHTEGPQHVHLQGRVQAGQPTPQLLVHLGDRVGVAQGPALLSRRAHPGWVVCGAS